MNASDLSSLVSLIKEKRKEMPTECAMLAGISGIDASGKGFVSAKLADLLKADLRVAVIHADDWLELPHIRFCKTDPGGHFYRHALRLDEMFKNLILPLRENRRVRLTAAHLDETANEFRQYRYDYENIEIVLLEGIFLFKREYVKQFDLKIWIDCRFETAIDRAVARSQEGLSPEQTISAYQNIYFPSQMLHFEFDKPIGSADIVVDNNLPLDIL